VAGDRGLYADPSLYEAAFSYRDIGAEVDAIEAWFARGRGGRPQRVLEVAAGPAAHAIELARRGSRAVAVDLSGVMCAYARRRGLEAGVALDVVQADMIRFRIPRRRFDLALVMLDSASHILDLDAMVSHLRSVASHLSPGGLYVMEMSHPADFLAGMAKTQDRWRVTRGGRRVDVRWTAPLSGFDPVTQVWDNSLSVTVTEKGRRRVVRDRIVLRRWTATELDAAARLAGGLCLAERHGSFDVDGAFGERGSDEWRMISVFERC
jgi:SAM-dependent methyltransferase